MPGLFRAFLALPPSSLWLHLLQPLANFTHDMDFMVKKRIDPNVIDKFLWTIISGFVVALLLSRPFKVSKRLLNCGHSAGRYARRLERLLGQLKGLKEVIENVSILRVEKMDLFLARTNVQWPAGHVALDLSSPSAYNEKVELATFPYLRVLRISGHPVHILTTAPILLPHASGLSKLFVQGGTDLALIYPLLFGSCNTLTSLTLTGYFSFNQAQIDDLGLALRRCGFLRFMRLEHNWLYAAISDLDRQVPNVSPLIEGVTASPFLEELIVKIEHTPPDLLVKSLPPSLRILGISLLPSMQPRSVLSHLRTRMSRLSNLQTLKLYPTYRQAGEYLKGIDAEAAGLGLVVKIYRLDHLGSAKWWTYQFKMDDEQEEEKDTMSELSWRWFTKS
ncbi:hypothetical protein BT69DRAFT_1298691 [Atractiella rhizophila]|nr:hypothetical protein BT69DRAFT_1298691 [Atractiella rhizophila]